MKTRNINTSIIEKGLKSLDNPVLRGSFTLVLSKERMDFFDNIAKNAFLEIMSDKLYDLSLKSTELKTIHLKTDICGIQKNRPGVYVIKNVETGMSVIGQTKKT